MTGYTLTSGTIKALAFAIGITTIGLVVGLALSVARPSIVEERALGQAILSQAEGQIFQVQSKTTLISEPNLHLRPNAWSPDGRSFLYQKLTDRVTDEATDPKTGDRYRVGIYELWQYLLDGGQKVLLSDNGFSGTWSANGQQVRYFSYNADGTSVESRMTNLANRDTISLFRGEALWLHQRGSGAAAFVQGGRLVGREANGQALSWLNATVNDPVKIRFWLAPDESALVLGQGSTLTLLSRNGDRVQLTSDYGFELSDVAWSPDGKKLAFVSARPNARVQVYDTGSKTTTVLTVTPAAWNEEYLSPDWSPDGQVITFTRQQRRSEAPASLWAVRVDGSVIQKVADDVITAYWASDGRHLVYRAARTSEIGVIPLQ